MVKIRFGSSSSSRRDSNDAGHKKGKPQSKQSNSSETTNNNSSEPTNHTIQKKPSMMSSTMSSSSDSSIASSTTSPVRCNSSLDNSVVTSMDIMPLRTLTNSASNIPPKPCSNDDDDNARMTLTSPKKQKTARKVLNFFDSPRKALFRSPRSSPKKKSRLPPSPSSQQKPQRFSTPNPRTPPSTPTTTTPQSSHTPIRTNTSRKYGTNTNHHRANVLTWLHDELPRDILPKVLSYAGVHRVQALSLTNRSWNGVCREEAVWRTMCEDTGKWVKGRDSEPLLMEDNAMEEGGVVDMEVDDAGNHQKQQQSETKMDDRNNHQEQQPPPVDKAPFWRQYYCDNPIVPLDYSTLNNALAGVSSRSLVPGWDPNTSRVLHTLPARDIRILLRPDFYEMSDRVMVDVDSDYSFTVETLESVGGWQRDCGDSSSLAMSPMPRAGSERITPRSSPSFSSSSSTPRRRTPSLRDFLSCRSTTNNAVRKSASKRARTPTPKHAVLIFKSRKKNEPVFHIRQGTLHLSKLILLHNSPGVDIWDGNAAIQIQPPIVNERPTRVQPPHKAPSAIISQSDICSLSGRGIVAIDGGYVTIRQSCIHNCAATGIYIGGPGSGATVERTDVVYNGNGNERSRRGVARGHSGVYLEQGVASLTDCNVSNNALTGCSAVSRDKAFLTIVDSDVVGNGTLQLEMPPNGTESRSRSVWRNNNTATVGIGRFRSEFAIVPPPLVGNGEGNVFDGGVADDGRLQPFVSPASVA